MNLEIDLAALAVVVAIGSLLITFGTFWRAGDWRKSEVWKSLGDRLMTIEAKVGNLESRTGELPSKIGTINDRLTRVEAHLDDMPSKADFAALEAGLKAMGQEVDVVRDGVIRIEQYLLGRING